MHRVRAQRAHALFEKNLFTGPRAAKSKKLHKLKRVGSLLLTLAVVIGVIVIVLFMVVPELYNSFATIGRQATWAVTRIPSLLNDAADLLPMFAEEIESLRESFMDINWREIGVKVSEFLQESNFLSSTFSIASSVVSGVTNTIIGIVFAIYTLLQKENLGRQFRRLFYALFPEQHVDQFLRVCHLTSASFSSFLSGQCLEAFILATMFFISMSLLGMPYALVVAVLIGVTALIPIFGAFIGCFVGVFLILIASPIKALWFLVLFLGAPAGRGQRDLPACGRRLGRPAVHLGAGRGYAGRQPGRRAGHAVCDPLVSVVYTLLREHVRRCIRERGIAEKKIQ